MTNQSAHLKVPNGRVNTSMEKSDTELNVCPSPSSVFLDPDTTKAASSTPSLTDFLDVRTLQEIQNNFSVLTHLHTMIRNADGQPITVSTDIAQRDESNQILEQLIETDQTADHPYLAPIIVNGQRLGSITIERKLDIPVTEASSNLRRLATKMDIDLNQTEKLILAAQTDARQAQPPNADDIQSLVLLANNISRLCCQDYELRRQVNHLQSLYKMSRALIAPRDLNTILQTGVQQLTQAMAVKAASIRLLDDEGKKLLRQVTCNLSKNFTDKSLIAIEENPIFSSVLQGEVVYVADMGRDQRIHYGDEVEFEKLTSMLCAPIVYQGYAIGVVELFSGQLRQFSDAEINLLQTMIQILATSLKSPCIEVDQWVSRHTQHQIQVASDVQQRMMPIATPHLPPFDLAARYVPTLKLGGDFYDFINLDRHLGIAIGDVVGKGVPASLLMASVRASLRAYAQDLFDVDEVMSRVNAALTRDTIANEFATLFYGVLDPTTWRLTYCNAGHCPPILLRNGRLSCLKSTGMVIGIDPDLSYDMGLLNFQDGDLLMLYTDGLPDAMNSDQEKFGMRRIEQALGQAAEHNMNAHDTLNHILQKMRCYTGLKTSIDDTTLLVIKAHATHH